MVFNTTWKACQCRDTSKRDLPRDCTVRLVLEDCCATGVLRRASTIMSENKQKDVPSELLINEKWDTCLERTVINFGIGLVSAGLAGVVLTRAPGMRRAVMGFGAGCGVGSSWVVCSQEFAKKK